ncbi:MAG: hypothetical protein R2824_03825 [Saprospiraceae bacterium]|nr:hypothetical protein [Lewinella sp.]
MDLKRRTFLQQSGTLATSFMLTPAMDWSQLFPGTAGPLDELLKNIFAWKDTTIEALLEKQINDPGRRWHGGLANAHDIPNPHSTSSFVVVLASVYTSEASKYHLAPQLEVPLARAVDCLLNVQYEDGSIDLYSTNFHSPPDTAFLINDLCPVYLALRRSGGAGTKETIDQLGKFILRAAKCLTVGGIHTPNHRWVVSSALSRVNEIFPDQQYVDRIDRWLSEGIDIDPDGQYTEQSVAVYSPIVDQMFITLGRLLDRPAFFDLVRRNLDMSLYYIQPGGEVLTDASGRQDSSQIGYVSRYYYAYRYMAVRDNNPVYAAVCALIEREYLDYLTRVGVLPLLLTEDPIFDNPMPQPGLIPENYFKRFLHSGVFRIRRGDVDLSVIEQNPTFLVFKSGLATLQSMRLHAAFYGDKGQFKAEQTELSGEKITLKRSVTHGYFQPFPSELIPGDGDWEKMPREEREMSEVQTLDYEVMIQEAGRKVAVEITISGVDHIPVCIEMNFRSGGDLSGSIIADEQQEDAWFLEEGMGTYQVEEDVIHFGPGKAEHKWSQIRGIWPKPQGDTVYLTGYTPFRHVVELS